MFKADFIECTVGCQQDSFFGVIQPGRCNSEQTLRGTGNHVAHGACSQDQPAEERRTMITVTCCTFQGCFLIHFVGGTRVDILLGTPQNTTLEHFMGVKRPSHKKKVTKKSLCAPSLLCIIAGHSVSASTVFSGGGSLWPTLPLLSLIALAWNLFPENQIRRDSFWRQNSEINHLN